VRSRSTPTEARFPNISEFAALAQSWAADANQRLLGYVWAGYDLLRAEVLQQIDCRKDDRDLERCITQLLEPRIRKVMPADAPFYIQHGPYEDETAVSAQAQPPQYDLAFVLFHNPRVMWPLEAKILRTPGAVAPYVKEVGSNFLTCRYSPFSSEAAMLGYLVAGSPKVALTRIQISLGTKLKRHPPFTNRQHATSDHSRSVPASKTYPREFRCHHMIFPLT
jgi:hypothetical protein